jgi:hypothetical protein
MGQIKNSYRILVRKLKGRGNYRGLDINRRMTITLIS